MTVIDLKIKTSNLCTKLDELFCVAWVRPKPLFLDVTQSCENTQEEGFILHLNSEHTNSKIVPSEIWEKSPNVSAKAISVLSHDPTLLASSNYIFVFHCLEQRSQNQRAHDEVGSVHPSIQPDEAICTNMFRFITQTVYHCNSGGRDHILDSIPDCC